VQTRRSGYDPVSQIGARQAQLEANAFSIDLHPRSKKTP